MIYRVLPKRKKYSVIYADPPWSYKDKAAAGKRGAGFKYNTMTKEELTVFAEEVNGISEKDCHLFLWATMPLLPQAIEFMRIAGFEYKTVAFVWIKTNYISDSLFMGMGNHTRANAEICLLGVRGKLTRISAKERQVVVSPIEKHSKKPDEIRTRIENLYGKQKRIELFARQVYNGWDSFGDELGGV